MPKSVRWWLPTIRLSADYRSIVLTAFQNVADSLRALDYDAAMLKQKAEVESLSLESLDLNTQQFKLEAISYLTLLDAPRTISKPESI
ncbi:MAG: hypothetical protein H7240_01325 [Glaciimonas sp.]|nr:hypothetical protein [Glaciimonas sp.]